MALAGACLMPFCICLPGHLTHGCPDHNPADAATLESIHRMLIRILENQEKIMANISDLQAADTSLQAAVATVLADFATALSNAQGNPAAIGQVVTDMNTMAAQLQAADPANASAPPAGGTTPPAA